MAYASDVATRPREAFHKSGSNRIGNCHKHNWNRPSVLHESRNYGRIMRNDEVWRQTNQFLCGSAHQLQIAVTPAIVDLEIASVAPTQFFEAGFKRSGWFLNGRRSSYQNPDPSHPRWLLCRCRERPGGHGGAEEQKELAPFDSVRAHVRTVH